MSAGASRSKHWAVVGGGMLGCCLAHRLRRAGHAVTLIEAAPALGGLAGAWQLGDVVWDRHYHVTLLSDERLRGILREIGVEDEMDWRETRTGAYAGGQLYSVSNALELLRFPALNLLDTLRLGLTVFAASRMRDWKKLERIPVEDWLVRWSGRRTFDRFWLPLLRSKLGEAWRETSAAFIWATIARLYAARRTGLKREMFGYVRGGYARILERFAEVLRAEGVKIELGRRVESVDRAGGELALRFADGETARFDRAVVTLAAPQAARICSALDEAERERLAKIRYQGIVCASLLTKKPLAGYYVTNILDNGVPFTGVIEMSALVDPLHFGGHGLVYLPRYAGADDPVFRLSDAQLEDRFVAGLERVMPGFRRDDVLAFRVSRVREVFPLSTLGYSDGVPGFVTSVPGLYLAGSAQIVNGTLNVNETLQLAERALDEALLREDA